MYDLVVTMALPALHINVDNYTNPLSTVSAVLIYEVSGSTCYIELKIQNVHSAVVHVHSSTCYIKLKFEILCSTVIYVSRSTHFDKFKV